MGASDKPNVKEQATKKDINALIWALKDKDGNVRTYAAEALKKLQG